MPLSSYRVESPVYIRPPSFVRVQPEKIAPEEIKSMQGGQPNVAADFFKPRIVSINGIPFVESRTSNKRYLEPAVDYLKPGHGYFSQQDDYEIDGMKRAGEDVKPAMFSIIPKNPDFALIASPRSRMDFPNKSTPVNLQTSHEIVNAFDPNRLGFAYSKIRNMEGILRSMVVPGSEHYAEAAEWIDFLAKKGYTIDKSPHSGIIGLGVGKGDFLAAYYPGGYLVREVNFHNKAKSEISRYGLSDSESIEAMKRSVLLHEFGHVVGIKSEKLQGLLQAEFYTMMADRYKGTKWERIYRALAQEGKNYAREHSLANKIFDIMGEVTSEERTIFKEYKRKFLTEALVKGEIDIQSYVDRRMEETFGGLKNEPSYRTAKTKSKSESTKSKSEKSSTPRRKGLETLIEALEKEADALGADRAEYISNQLAKNPNYAKDSKAEPKAEKEAPHEATAEAN